MTASVTFGNINGHTNPASHITLHVEQERAEPEAETTPTQRCRWRECGGVMHRGGSLSKEEEGEVGPQEEGEGDGDEETPPVPPARSVSEFALFSISLCVHRPK